MKEIVAKCKNCKGLLHQTKAFLDTVAKTPHCSYCGTAYSSVERTAKQLNRKYNTASQLNQNHFAKRQQIEQKYNAMAAQINVKNHTVKANWEVTHLAWGKYRIQRSKGTWTVFTVTNKVQTVLFANLPSLAEAKKKVEFYEASINNWLAKEAQGTSSHLT